MVTVAGWANIVAVPLGVLGLLNLLWDRSRQRPLQDPGRLGDAAELLATKVRQQWTVEMGVRRLRHPRPLRLRWQATQQPASLLPALIGRGSLVEAGDVRPPASDLVDAFRRLSARQLVVVGAPGAGKTTLAILFTLAALGRSGRWLSPRAWVDEPVPVLLTVAGWRPEDESVRDWVARRIGEDYPELKNSLAASAGTPAELLDQGMVMPILDGLDEMPAARLAAALKALNDAGGADGLNMMLTCRREEYERAVSESGPLTVAAVVTVQPITVEDSIEFLTEGEVVGSTRWDGVAERMRADPQGPLVSALSTPLMTALARTVYGPTRRDPNELTGLPSPAAIESHLVEGFLPTVYPSGRSAQAIRSLSVLACHLQHLADSSNLAWWQLAKAVPRGVIVGVVVCTTVAFGALGGAVVGPFDLALASNVAFGAVLGLAVGVVAGLSAARSITRTAPRSRAGLVLGVVAAAARDGLAVSVAVAVAVFAIGSPSLLAQDVPPYPWWNTLLYLLRVAMLGGLAGFVVSLIANGLGAGRASVPNRPALRFRMLFPRLAAGIGTGMLVAVPVGLLVGLLEGATGGQLRAGVFRGLWAAVAVGCGVIGVPVGVGRWLNAPSLDQDGLSPRSVLRGDWLTLMVVTVSAGLSAGVGFTYLLSLFGFVQLVDVIPFAATYDPVIGGIWGGLVVFAVVFLGSGSPWLTYTVARLWLALWGRLPWRLMNFLEDAHRRNVLRQAGPVYQFRHNRLQEHLAEQVPKERSRFGRWLLQGKDERTAGDQISLLRARRVRRRVTAATIAAFVVLPGLVAIAEAPNVSNAMKRQADLERSWWAARLEEHADEIQDDHPDSALQLRIAAAEIYPDDSSRYELWAFLRAQSTGAARARARTRTEALGSRWAVLVDGDRTAYAWDLAATQLRTINLGTDVTNLDDGNKGVVSVVHGNGTTEVWDTNAQTTHPIDLGPDQNPQSILQVSGDGRWAVAEDGSDSMTVLDLNTGHAHPVDFGPDVQDVKISDGSRWAMVYHTDGTATAWDLASSPPKGPMHLGSNVDNKASVIGDRWAVLVGTDRKATAIDLMATPTMTVDLGSGITAAKLGADSRFAVVQGSGGTVTAWNLAAAPAHKVVVGPADPARDIAFGGSWVEVVLSNRTATAVNLETGSTRVDLGQDVTDVGSTRDEPWALVTRGSGVAELVTPSGRRIDIGQTSARPSVVSESESPWVIVEGTDGKRTALDITSQPTRRVDLGSPMNDLRLGTDGQSVLTVYRRPMFGGTLTILWDLSVLASQPPPADLTTNPLRYACDQRNPSLSRDEWRLYAPDVDFHQTCQPGPTTPR